jgi:hypothetical protein
MCHMSTSCNYCSSLLNLDSACWHVEEGHRYLVFDCSCGKEISIPEQEFNPMDYYSKSVQSKQPRVYE